MSAQCQRDGPTVKAIEGNARPWFAVIRGEEQTVFQLDKSNFSKILAAVESKTRLLGNRIGERSHSSSTTSGRSRRSCRSRYAVFSKRCWKTVVCYCAAVPKVAYRLCFAGCDLAICDGLHNPSDGT